MLYEYVVRLSVCLSVTLVYCVGTANTLSYFSYHLVSVITYAKKVVFYAAFFCLSLCLIVCLLATLRNKKLSYPQRKCASNVAILYGEDGISI